jgi:hypothetical protein
MWLATNESCIPPTDYLLCLYHPPQLRWDVAKAHYVSLSHCPLKHLQPSTLILAGLFALKNPGSAVARDETPLFLQMSRQQRPNYAQEVLKQLVLCMEGQLLEHISAKHASSGHRASPRNCFIRRAIGKNSIACANFNCSSQRRM